MVDQKAKRGVDPAKESRTENSGEAGLSPGNSAGLLLARICVNSDGLTNDRPVQLREITAKRRETGS